MLRRLLHRNIALLVGVVLAGQMLAGLMVLALVARPQSQRLADVSASMIHALSIAMETVPPERRDALIAQLNSQGNIHIQPGSQTPSDGAGYPSLLERQFMQALVEKLSTQNEIVWRTDRGHRLWVKLAFGHEYYWVSISAPRLGGPLVSLFSTMFAAFLVATVGGIILQRRLDRPLRNLARGVENYDPGADHSMLPEEGPQEIAAVAHAFNRMTRRLTEQEAERALMLAGVSHDLRTPLARLRLSLEMMRGHDAGLEESAERQVDHIERMLGQFLDFARGFEDEKRSMTAICALVRRAADHAGLAGRFTIDCPPELAASVRPHALERAVGNLMANAARHGQAPFLCKAELTADGTLKIAVRDSGPGMPTERAAELCRPFARGDSARGGDSTGLGLAIVNRIAQAHGGTLGFQNDGDGFAAILQLPPG